MAYSYAQLQEIKTRIVRDLSAEQQKLDSAVGQFTAIKNALTSMQSNYTVWATEVNDLLAASPADPAVIALKAERDLLVSEFATTKTSATDYETAVNGV